MIPSYTKITMRSIFSRIILFGSVFFCFSFGALTAEPEQNVDKPVLKNIALWNTNARLISVIDDRLGDPLSSGGIGGKGEIGLINGDVGNTFTVEKGNQAIVIDLSQPYDLTKINLATLSGKGVVTAYCAKMLRNVSSKRWMMIGQPINASENEVISFDVGGMSGRYVMLKFEVENQLTFTSPGVFSTILASDWMIDVAEKPEGDSASDLDVSSNSNNSAKKTVPLDFGSVSSGASILYASGADAEEASGLIDDDVETYLELTDGEEREFSAVVIDLSKKRDLAMMSFLIDGDKGQLNLFALSDIEELKTTYQENTFKNEFYVSEGLDDLVPGAAGQDVIANYINGRPPSLSIPFSGDMQSVEEIANLAARYILMVFVPENPQNSNFRLFETSFLAEVAEEDLIVTQVLATAADGSTGNAIVIASPTAFNPDNGPPLTLVELQELTADDSTSVTESTSTENVSFGSLIVTPTLTPPVTP